MTSVKFMFMYFLFLFLVWRDPGQAQGSNFPSPKATMLALRLDCSTAALTTPQKVLPIWKLVELKVLDFGDRTRTGISILTSAADTIMFMHDTHQLFPFHAFQKMEKTLQGINYQGIQDPESGSILVRTAELTAVKNASLMGGN